MNMQKEKSDGNENGKMLGENMEKRKIYIIK